MGDHNGIDSRKSDPIQLATEKFASSWPKTNTHKNEIQWIKGDLALEYLESVNRSGTPETEASILKSLAESVNERLESMRVYAWVSKVFTTEKRKKGLSWSHYRSAAGSNNPEHWIEKACNDKLNVRSLNAKIAVAEKKTKKRIKLDAICTNCSTSLMHKRVLKLYEDDRILGSFCSYVCLTAYSGNAAVKNKILES